MSVSPLHLFLGDVDSEEEAGQCCGELGGTGILTAPPGIAAGSLRVESLTLRAAD